jgi:hypothetical protein
MSSHELPWRSNRRWDLQEMSISRTQEDIGTFQKTKFNVITILRIRQSLYRLNFDHGEIISDTDLSATDIHAKF